MKETNNLLDLSVYRQQRKERALRILPQLRQEEQLLLRQLESLRQRIAEVEAEAEVNLVKTGR